MRAVRIHSFGAGPQVDEIPEPQAGSGELLVRMRHVALNPLDNWVTQGTVAGGRQTLPMVLGCEGVGDAGGRLVVVHGGGVGTLRDGLLCEVAAVPQAACSDVPDGVDPVQASALAIVGVTAWRLVHDTARVAKGETALVLGAGGGVGTMLVQVLRNAGARVLAQTSTLAKEEGLRALGADEILVCLPEELPELDPAPAVVFDPLAGGATALAVERLAAHGRIALFGASLAPHHEIDLRALYRKAGSILGYSGTIEPPEVIHAALREVFAEAAAGRLRVPVAARLPLAGSAEGLRRLLDHDVEGKIVVDV